MHAKQWLLATSALALSWLGAGDAYAVAQEVTVSGNTWVAYGVIGAIILGIIFFVLISIRATAGREPRDDGIFFGDDDKPD